MKIRKTRISFLALILAAVVLFSQFSWVEPFQANAASSGELQAQLDALEAEKDKIEEKLKELEGKLSANMGEMERIIAQKDIIDQEIFTLYQKTENINAQLTAYSKLIADKQLELEIAQSRQKELNKKNKERIRAMEEDGAVSYWSVLFEASSFSDFLDRLNMVEEIALADQHRLKEMSEAAEAVAAAKAELEANQAALEVTKAELEEASKLQEKKRAEAEALLKELIAIGEEYEKYIADAEAEESDIASKIEKTENLYENAKYQEWLATSQPARPSNGGGTAGESTNTAGVTWL